MAAPQAQARNEIEDYKKHAEGIVKGAAAQAFAQQATWTSGTTVVPSLGNTQNYSANALTVTR